ncbi:MAG: enoyl-CoA hydratase/isomerase family protein [Phycisphaerales bacterium]|nr:enoyl-CoA hydratase/isomerase family protein [Phycisphaerales bacterium]
MTSELFTVTIDSGADGAKIAILTLDQPGRPVVVIDQDLLYKLDATLDSLPADIDGFILASAAERAFVAGADLKAIMALNDEDLNIYLEYGAKVFQKIADLPCPTAAAIHSVTLGGGLELAMHCDGLIGLINPDARPFIIGLPEAGLKICPGWGGTNLLPARIDPETAIVATANGIPFKSTDALELGMFDAHCTSSEDLIETAKNWIESQSNMNRTGHPSRCIQTTNTDTLAKALVDAKDELDSSLHVDAVLDAIVIGISAGWNSALKSEREHLVNLRHSEPAQEAINAFFSKTTKK